MFESLDENEPPRRLSGSPTLVAAIVLSGVACLIAALLGSDGKCEIAMLLTASLIYAMSSEWHHDNGWRFWLTSIAIFVVNACLVIFIPWPVIPLNRFSSLLLAIACIGLIHIDGGIFTVLRRKYSESAQAPPERVGK